MATEAFSTGCNEKAFKKFNTGQPWMERGSPQRFNLYRGITVVIQYQTNVIINLEC